MENSKGVVTWKNGEVFLSRDILLNNNIYDIRDYIRHKEMEQSGFSDSAFISLYMSDALKAYLRLRLWRKSYVLCSKSESGIERVMHRL